MSQFPEATNWKMFIGGEWVEAADGDRKDVITPIDRNVVIATVANGKEEDADRAVKAARKAFPEWAALPFKERQKMLIRCADALEAGSEELAQLTAIDTGNAIRTQARPETIILADLFRYMGG
ncbi:MAG: aldehyde dehydrogenase family protein, partial [Brevibacterium aurantiacum]|nr:aldehyde dehydrogenase family protein [Brevibacterium aurantiacum]